MGKTALCIGRFLNFLLTFIVEELRTRVSRCPEPWHAAGKLTKKESLRSKCETTRFATDDGPTSMAWTYALQRCLLIDRAKDLRGKLDILIQDR